jgi:hypothetical protein
VLQFIFKFKQGQHPNLVGFSDAPEQTIISYSRTTIGGDGQSKGYVKNVQ